MLNRSRRVLNRCLLGRFVDHRCAGTAVVDRATGIRGRRVTADRASGAAAALDDRPLLGGRCRAVCRRSGRAVLSRDSAVAGDAAASAERGAFLAENSTVSSAAGARADATVGSAARETAAYAGARGAASPGVAADTCATGNCRGARLRCRVAAHPAFTVQHGGAASTADAQASAAGRGGTALAADADTPERTCHVGSGGAVQRRAFASDQPRLTARAGAQCRVPPRAGQCADIAGASELTAGTETRLTRQNGLASSAAAERAAGLTAETSLATGAETTASLTPGTSPKTATELTAST
jgi:hypothetical protein